MPGYSPEFNSIEALWSVIKRRVKARLAFRKDVNLEEEGFRNLVLNVLDEVTPEEQQRAAATNNRHYLHRTIGDIISKLTKEKKDVMLLDEVGSDQLSSVPEDLVISNHDSGFDSAISPIRVTEDDVLSVRFANDDYYIDESKVYEIPQINDEEEQQQNDLILEQHIETDDPILRMLRPNSWDIKKPA